MSSKRSPARSPGAKRACSPRRNRKLVGDIVIRAPSSGRLRSPLRASNAKAKRTRSPPSSLRAFERLAAKTRQQTRRALERAERKRAIHDYFATGEHDAIVESVVAEAMDKLLGDGKPLPRNAAVVFDVDDTVLGTHPSYRPVAVSRLTREARATMPKHFHPPISAVMQLYDALVAAGVKVLVLTGRYARHRKETVENLRWVGFDTWHDAAFREPHEEEMTARDYKEMRRREWAERHGLRIIGSVGDQLSDLEGAHAGHPVHIPNPAYTIH
jgi:phosphoglycolate phosphatase-like HAD superfamily hydrolase